jgi:hypothetical protein
MLAIDWCLVDLSGLLQGQRRQQKWRVYDSATASFLRIWLMLMAELFLWGIPGLATGMVFNGLRLSRFQIGLVGAVVAVVGFAGAVFAQPYLLPFAFPGGI